MNRSTRLRIEEVVNSQEAKRRFMDLFCETIRYGEYIPEDLFQDIQLKVVPKEMLSTSDLEPGNPNTMIRK